MVISVTFNGLIQTRTVNELLWGYDDPFLHNIASMDPAQGGNPFIDTHISLMHNMTEDMSGSIKQSFYTGNGDFTLIRQYNSIFGSPYVSVKEDWFNGNESVSVLRDAWRERAEYVGTDLVLNRPNLNSDNVEYLPIFQTDLIRYANITKTPVTVEYEGLETWRFELDPKAFYNKTENPAMA